MFLSFSRKYSEVYQVFEKFFSGWKRKCEDAASNYGSVSSPLLFYFLSSFTGMALQSPAKLHQFKRQVQKSMLADPEATSGHKMVHK